MKKNEQSKEDIRIVEGILMGVVSQLEGDSTDYGLLAVSSFGETLIKTLSLPADCGTSKIWGLLDDATCALGQVAYNIKSAFFQRIVEMCHSFLLLDAAGRKVAEHAAKEGGGISAKDIYDYFLPRKKTTPFVREFIECFDLLTTEVRFIPERLRSGIWAKRKSRRNDDRKIPDGWMESFRPTPGMSCKEATAKSRAVALHNLALEFPGFKDKADKLATHFDELTKSLVKGVVGPNPMSEMLITDEMVEDGYAPPVKPAMYNDLKALMTGDFLVNYDKFYDMGAYFRMRTDGTNDLGFKEIWEESDIFEAKERMLNKLKLFVTSAAAMARRTESESASQFLRVLELLEKKNGYFSVITSLDDRAELEEFMESLINAQERLRRDVEIAKLGAKQPIPVEVADDSVKKLAGATGAAVKKAIKPGKGSSNERFPEETKRQCQSIWEEYKDNLEVKKHAIRHKVSHNNVFEYAKAELARLEPVAIRTANDFDRALGAKSDKKYRDSPAVRKKNRDKKRQTVYSPYNNFLSKPLKCRP